MARRSPRRSRPCLLLAEPGPARDRLRDALQLAQRAVRTLSTAAEAEEALDEQPAALVVSQELGGPAVSDLIRRGASRRVPVLVLGAASAGPALDAACEDAADFVAAPVEVNTVLRRLDNLLRGASPTLVGLGAAEEARALGLVGRSRALRAVLEKIERISRYETNVLVLGETGTGKELVARALHACGPHRESLFVPVNCAALGRDIIENELFGHERGAFTGANERKRGLFEVADGGTLFLDEIGEMEPSTQSKLLRVLERNEFRRVGGSGKIKVDVSVVAATNQDLDRAVESGRFREDLYHRLRVITVVVPPLRERKEDVPVLAEHFLAEFNARHGAALERLSPAALELLARHDWPGNVRELKHTIESAAILAPGPTISVADVEPLLAPARRRADGARAAPDALSIPVGLPLAEVERRVIAATLPRCASRVEAARALGIGLRTLYTKLRQYGVGPSGDAVRERQSAAPGDVRP